MKLKIKQFQPRRPPANERLTIYCMLKARFCRKPGKTTVDRTSSEMCTPQWLGATALRVIVSSVHTRVERLKNIINMYLPVLVPQKRFFPDILVAMHVT